MKNAKTYSFASKGTLSTLHLILTISFIKQLEFNTFDFEEKLFYTNYMLKTKLVDIEKYKEIFASQIEATGSPKISREI